MDGEALARNEPQESGRTDPPEGLKHLVNRGEMEVVTTASGEVLYIVQSLDE
jgi:hypothetical protein